MSARTAAAAVAVAVTVAACGASATPPPSVSVAPVPVRPAGAQEITAPPVTAVADCGDPEASLRPGPLAGAGAMPAGSSMARIQARGRLIAGVDQNTFMFGFRDPRSGQLVGFDIDLAREIARAVFGEPGRIELQVVDAGQRELALQSGQVDVVVRTFSITCERKRNVGFSAVYFYANQRILARKGSGIDGTADLSGKRVCAVAGTTSLGRIFALRPRPTLIGVTSWTDCLLMQQQGQIDAISTDDVVLAGLAAQDPAVDVVGASLGVEPYGVGVRRGDDDVIRFVNGVLERIRADGTWERLYASWLRSLGPSPGPPQARYQD
ncbi:glutamate ABC transporter substrate-binding protein [Mycobacterium sp. ITM-2016-00317]|uniref:glutamate ABC transporter substrate-binding protein n=1 Tax=Mycobacterium sp. ITM-2016-00317 TaxID=2099694 RepID=UPI000D4D091A|nr:glutamate ABC transporter substrate-binding protein [Mycobacterium sp. ITM-2016-00317]WNG88568.1 glutamate ABC transporter substrate-binding protein [Mycobacterium sp. ITM-2016-00317]